MMLNWSRVSEMFINALMLLSVLFGFVPTSAVHMTDYSALVYKNCTSETFPESSMSHTQTLSAMFQDLVSHSLQSKFFKATAGDEHAGISGLFQCKGDLSNQDCHHCVTKFPDLSNILCSHAMAARIQLYGCYLRYETDSVSLQKAQVQLFAFNKPHSFKYEIQHKVCERGHEEGGSVGGGGGGVGMTEGLSKWEEGGGGFGGEGGEGFGGGGEGEGEGGDVEEMKDKAFEELEGKVGQDGRGYGEAEYGLFHVEAQCEEDMEGCDCAECVHKAIEFAKEDEECRSALRGAIFLERCSLRFDYNHLGGGGHEYPEEHDENGGKGKQLAIILGGAAALVLLVLFALLLRSGRKDDY